MKCVENIHANIHKYKTVNAVITCIMSHSLISSVHKHLHLWKSKDTACSKNVSVKPLHLLWY